MPRTRPGSRCTARPPGLEENERSPVPHATVLITGPPCGILVRIWSCMKKICFSRRPHNLPGPIEERFPPGADAAQFNQVFSDIEVLI
jgi:hypothetical protein